MMITAKKHIYNFTNLENYPEICLIIVVYLRREIHNLHCFVRFYFPFAFLFSECWYEFGKYDFNDENRSGIRRFCEIDKNTIQYISRKRWVVCKIVRIDYCCIRYLRHMRMEMRCVRSHDFHLNSKINVKYDLCSNRHIIKNPVDLIMSISFLTYRSIVTNEYF